VDDGPAVTDQESCDAHPGLGAEFRALALGALDRLEPVVERVRHEPPTESASACESCPVCAVLAVVRGERPELAARLAEQLGGLLAVLRAALEEGDPAGGAPGPGPHGTAPPTPRPESGTPARTVQRIPIERVAP
jgi:hypothetical protein